MKKELCRFWKEHRTDAHEARIKECAKTLTDSIYGMSAKSLKDLAEGWRQESKMLQSASLTLMNTFIDAGIPEDQWQDQVLANLVQAHAYNEMVKTVESRMNRPKSDGPPQRRAGESDDAYRARLIAYADTLGK